MTLTLDLQELFHCIDNRDAAAFEGFLADDVVFRFGNAAAVKGHTQVARTVAAFFQSIQALHHEIAQTWAIDTGWVCHGTVIYTRFDGSVLRVPFANIFELARGRIARYLIFADISTLYPTSHP